MATLAEVIESRQNYLTHVEGLGNRFSKFAPEFAGSRMDAVVGLPDDVAMRLYEALYLHNTHFTPDGLPGCGIATGDFNCIDGQNYLMLKYDVMAANVAMLQMFRPHERNLQMWVEGREALRNKLIGLIGRIFSCKRNFYRLQELKKVELFMRTAQDRVLSGTPKPELISDLRTAADRLVGRKVAGSARLVRDLREFVAELSVFAGLPEAIAGLKQKIGHQGSPYIKDGLLMLNSPSYSASSSLYTTGASDDIADALPNANDFLMTLGQSGLPEFKYLSGGELRGEEYIFHLPKSPFFETVSRAMFGNKDLADAWLEIVRKSSYYDNLQSWEEMITPVKADACREVIPPIVSGMVLGFNLNLKDVPGTALLRPIISESLLTASGQMLEESGLQVVKSPARKLALSFGDRYGEPRSIFDEPAE